MAPPFDLYQNISKYLKYMAFVRTASPLTLRAYWLDLQQAFKIPMTVLVTGWGPQPHRSFKAEGDAFKVFDRILSEEQLLTESRAAFQGWTSLALSSRNRKAATLKSFLGWAHAENLTGKDLSERISCPKVPGRLPHYLSVDEITSLLASFSEESGEESLRQQSLILLLYGGGLRVSEACRLEWKSIDFSRRLLRIMGKGSKERLVPVPQKTLDILKLLRAKVSSDFVFGEKALDPRVAYGWVRERGRKTGLINELHPHALRHSYATHLLSGGANLRTLQELLGHESLRATEKYTHLGMDQLARTMEKSHPLGNGSRKNSKANSA